MSLHKTGSNKSAVSIHSCSHGAGNPADGRRETYPGYSWFVPHFSFRWRPCFLQRLLVQHVYTDPYPLYIDNMSASTAPLMSDFRIGDHSEANTISASSNDLRQGKTTSWYSRKHWPITLHVIIFCIYTVFFLSLKSRFSAFKKPSEVLCMLVHRLKNRSNDEQTPSQLPQRL